MRTFKKSLRIKSLPQDVLVEIAAKIASSSQTPLLDIKNLRRTCKSFRSVSSARKVGKSMAVYKERYMKWTDRQRYFGFLRHCANTGNAQASYVLALEYYFNLKCTSLGKRYLNQAMKGENQAAAYTLGVLEFCVPDTRSRAMDILGKIANQGDAGDNLKSGNINIENCRNEALEVLQAVTKWTKLVLEPKPKCGNQGCGRVVEGSNTWVQDENLKKSFCCQECRWRDEVSFFISLM